MLKRGAPHRSGPAMTASKRRESPDGSIEIDKQRIDRQAQLEYQCGVDDVLTARAPMHIGCRFGIVLGHFGSERIDERDRDVGGRASLRAETREIVAFDTRAESGRVGEGSRSNRLVCRHTFNRADLPRQPQNAPGTSARGLPSRSASA